MVVPWPRNGAEFLQLARRLAALNVCSPLEPIAANRGDQLTRQRIDHRRTDAVQATGMEIAIAIAELARRNAAW